MSNGRPTSSLQHQLDCATDTEQQAASAMAEAVVTRVHEARARVDAWDRARPGGVPSEISAKEKGLAAAKAELAAAEADARALRGDAGFVPGTSIPIGGANQPQPLQRAVARQDAILVKLREQGYDPQALPRPQAGHSGPKAAVKKALGSSGIWVGKTVFEKAWDQLRSAGQIRDCE